MQMGKAGESNVLRLSLTGHRHYRYRTDFQPRWMLREKRKQLVSHCVHVSYALMDMAAADPWKLVQRAFEYGFFFNGLAQVQCLHLHAILIDTRKLFA